MRPSRYDTNAAGYYHTSPNLPVGPTSRKVGVEDFCEIFYHALGLSKDDTIIDPTSRPVQLLPGGEVPREMI